MKVDPADTVPWAGMRTGASQPESVWLCLAATPSPPDRAAWAVLMAPSLALCIVFPVIGHTAGLPGLTGARPSIFRNCGLPLSAKTETASI